MDVLRNVFYTIAKDTTYEIEIKRSRFIAFSKYLKTEEEAKSFANSLKANYPDCSHVCYAYILGQKSEISKNNDGGEPAGSAGRAILGSLEKNKLTNSMIAVVRYFGGKKLGVSGLFRAYSKVSSEIIKAADFFVMRECSIYGFSMDYNDFSRVGKYMGDHGIPMLKQEYVEVVKFEAGIPVEIEAKTLSDITPMIEGKVMKARLRNSFIRFSSEK